MLSISTTYKQNMIRAIKLAAPITAGQLGMILTGFFDTLQIGGLGPEYIAAGGVSNTIYWLVTLLGMGVLFSVSPLVSEALGEQKAWKAIGVFRSGVLVAVLGALLFTGVMYLFTVHFSVFRQTEQITALSQKYLYIVNLSTPAFFLFTVSKQLLDGMGRTMVGMVINLCGLALNIFLNHIFIYGHLGAPALGIEGAAIATSITRWTLLLAILLFIWRDSKLQQLRKEFKGHIEAQKSYIGPVLRIGIPYGLQIFWEAASFSVAHIMSGWTGENNLAAHQIAINLASVTFMSVTGVSAAGTIMAGYSYGAKDAAGVRTAARSVFMLTLILELFYAALFLGGHKLFPHMYTNHAEVIHVASGLLILAAIFQLSDGFQNVIAGVLRGVQDVIVPSAIAFVSYWMVMVPLGYVLAFYGGLGVHGIWMGMIAGLTLAALLLLWRYRWRVKHLQFTEL